MATLERDGTDVVLRLGRLERLGSFASDIRIPRGSIAEVTTCTPSFAAVRGWRMMGTGIPGTVVLGTRRVSGGVRDFVAVYGRHPGSVVLDLSGNRFARLVVSAPDPQAVAASLR